MDTAHCSQDVQARLEQMLSHTSGLPHDAVDVQWHAPEEDEQALERYVRSLADEELIAAPGARPRPRRRACQAITSAAQ